MNSTLATETIDFSQLVGLVSSEITDEHDFDLDEHGIVAITKAWEVGDYEAMLSRPGTYLEMSKAEAGHLLAWLSELKVKGLL